jgi:hypothetical protein
MMDKCGSCQYKSGSLLLCAANREEEFKEGGYECREFMERLRDDPPLFIEKGSSYWVRFGNAVDSSGHPFSLPGTDKYVYRECLWHFSTTREEADLLLEVVALDSFLHKVVLDTYLTNGYEVKIDDSRKSYGWWRKVIRVKDFYQEGGSRCKLST